MSRASGDAGSVRTALLDAAEGQLERDGDLSTRTVCAEAGVTQPVLYRVFGDKRGLLDALAERGLAHLLARRPASQASTDPRADLAAEWDDRLRFADEHPELFRVMFSPSGDAHPAVRRSVLATVREAVRRCAVDGSVPTGLDTAAAAVLAANVGLALARIADPAVYRHEAVATLLRDAVLGAVLGAPSPEPTSISTAASRLGAHLETSSSPLAPEENALLRLWLTRITEAPPTPDTTEGRP